MREFMTIIENELNEVKMIDDFGDDGYQMERVFTRWTNESQDAPVIGNINGYELRNKEVGGQSLFYLFKDGECAGKATVIPALGMENTVKVSHIVVHPKHRRAGLGMGIYDHLLYSHDIVSDYDQTRYGRGMGGAGAQVCRQAVGDRWQLERTDHRHRPDLRDAHANGRESELTRYSAAASNI